MAPTLMSTQGTKTALLPRLTEEEYLRLDRAATEKSEFLNGQMYAMAGGSFNHSTLAGELAAMIAPQRPQGCRLINSDLRIHVPATGLYTYSDGGLVCGKPLFHTDQKDVLLNPVLLIEVLSPSSKSYDRGEKFEMYRTIESLREFLVVHQGRVAMEHHSKQADGSWTLRDYVGTEATIQITSLNLRIPLGELYAVALDLE